MSSETSAEKATRYEGEALTLVESAQIGADQEMDYRIGLDEAKPQISVETSALVPDEAAAYLARFVQGSRDPLSRLAETARSALANECIKLRGLTSEAVMNRIKLIAERKAYGIVPKSCVVYEDESAEALWHWEVTSNELLGPALGPAKEARTLRKKNGARIKALRKLIDVLIKHPDDAAKISKEEERVAKFQREDEAARLKLAALQRKRELKEEEEERKLEKKRLEQEARQKANEAKQRKLDAKQKKLAATQQQQSILMAFVKKAKSPRSTNETKKEHCNSSTDISPSQDGGDEQQEEKDRKILFDATELNDAIFCTATKNDFDLDKIAQVAPISVTELAATFRKEAEHMANERRRAALLAQQEDDDVILISESGVETEPKPKFFFFYNEYRGAYYDYTDRTSTVVLPTRPFAQDSNIDYDYDSDEEFAANDAQVEDAEDLNDDDDDDDMEDDEDADDRLDYDDGFLANDEEDEDDDQELKPNATADDKDRSTPPAKRRRIHLIVEPRQGGFQNSVPSDLSAYIPIVFYDPSTLTDIVPTTTKSNKKSPSSNNKRDAIEMNASSTKANANDKQENLAPANKKIKSKATADPGQIKLTSFFKTAAAPVAPTSSVDYDNNNNSSAA